MTDKQIRAKLERIASIQANRLLEDDLKTQMIAVSMTLRMVRGEQNYIDQWLKRAELQVIERHKLMYPGSNGCACSVCKPVKGVKG
jgi:hypothetical protein